MGTTTPTNHAGAVCQRCGGNVMLRDDMNTCVQCGEIAGYVDRPIPFEGCPFTNEPPEDKPPMKSHTERNKRMTGPEVEEASNMASSGKPWEVIGDLMDRNPRQVKKLVEEYREAEEKQAETRARQEPGTPAGPAPDAGAAEIPSVQELQNRDSDILPHPECRMSLNQAAEEPANIGSSVPGNREMSEAVFPETSEAMFPETSEAEFPKTSAVKFPKTPAAEFPEISEVEFPETRVPPSLDQGKPTEAGAGLPERDPPAEKAQNSPGTVIEADTDAGAKTENRSEEDKTEQDQPKKEESNVMTTETDATTQEQQPYGLTIKQAQEIFGNEKKTEEWLLSRRWPQGPRCPECDSPDLKNSMRRGILHYTCHTCNHSFSFMEGTPMEGTRVNIGAWMMVSYMVTAAGDNPPSQYHLAVKTGVSPNSAKRIVEQTLQAKAEDRLVYQTKNGAAAPADRPQPPDEPEDGTEPKVQDEPETTKAEATAGDAEPQPGAAGEQPAGEPGTAEAQGPGNAGPETKEEPADDALKAAEEEEPAAEAEAHAPAGTNGTGEPTATTVQEEENDTPKTGPGPSQPATELTQERVTANDLEELVHQLQEQKNSAVEGIERLREEIWRAQELIKDNDRKIETVLNCLVIFQEWKGEPAQASV